MNLSLRKWRVGTKGSWWAKGPVDGLSSQASKEFINRESYIFGYLSEQDRRYVPAPVERYRRATSIGMAELLMGAPLSGFLETKPLEHTNDLFWFEDRRFGHG